jgi:5-formyltetrahydrofolate cyclo-ligase
MTEDRKALRHDIRASRRAMSAGERIAAAEHLADHLLALPCMPKHGRVGGYWAVDGEIGLHAWQLQLPDTLVYCLPVLHHENQLRFAPWRPGAPLLPNRHGIPEPDIDASELLLPEDMALVTVPLVAFDAQCRRLGMGAGWYDRSFAFRRERAAPPWLVGAAFARQQVDALVSESWDVPLDVVCTERGSFTATPT